MRQLISILGNSQRLDGGAMFGNAPKALWSRWLAPDNENRVPLACRALLVQDNGRNILFETGIGAFFDPKMKERYGVVESDHILLNSLAAHGLSHHDIDVVVLSHLHFDHAGGLLAAYDAHKTPSLLFDRATYIVSEQAWDRACAPHSRDKASFIPELQQLLQASGRLEIVRTSTSPTLGPAYRFHLSHGHTPGLLLTEVDTDKGPLVFAGDLIPGTAWVHVPITMGYDRYPELLIDEKRLLLEDLVARHGRLFYTHDPLCAISGIEKSSDGRFKAIEMCPH